MKSYEQEVIAPKLMKFNKLSYKYKYRQIARVSFIHFENNLNNLTNSRVRL